MPGEGANSWQCVLINASGPANTVVPWKFWNLYLNDTALLSKSCMVKLEFEKYVRFMAEDIAWVLSR